MARAFRFVHRFIVIKTICCITGAQAVIDAEKTVYRLYALPLTAENIAVAANERFSRATPTPTPGYVLVYSDGDAPPQSEEITKERINLLSPADEQWLFDSNVAIIAEQIELHKPDVLGGLSESIAALEQELQKQKKEYERKGE